MTLSREAFSALCDRYDPPGPGEESVEPLLAARGLDLNDLVRLGLLTDFPGPTSEINHYQVAWGAETLIRPSQGCDDFVILAGMRDRFLEILERAAVVQNSADEDGLSLRRRELLVRLERIVAHHVVNGSAQGQPGGARNFRYPLVYWDHAHQKAVKVGRQQSLPVDLPEDEILSGSYHFGANHLRVMAALKEIVELLEDDHGLTFEKDT